jgi:uncharacterized protein
MNLKTKQQTLKIPVKKVAAVIFMSLVIGALFNTNGLYNWASRMNAGNTRSMILAIVEPLHSVAHTLSIDEPMRNLRSLFLSLSGIEKDAGWQYSQSAGNQGKQVERSTDSSSAIAAEEEESLRKRFVYSETNPLRVLFIGDSMIEGPIYVMFTRIIDSDKSIESSIKSRHSSGLSRPDYYNWQNEVEALFTKQKYDCVIVLLGTNDAQDLIVQGRTIPFNSKEWQSTYRSRTLSFISYLNDNVPEVYWIGLPRMKKPVFDSSMKIINDIHSNVCGNFKRVRYIPTNDLLGDKMGNYTDFITIGKQIDFFRAADGIHLLYPAGKIIADLLFDTVTRDFRFEAAHKK